MRPKPQLYLKGNNNGFKIYRVFTGNLQCLNYW